MTIIALDPGATTGWAAQYTDGAYAYGEVFEHKVWQTLSSIRPNLIIAERFIGLPNARNLIAVEVIGVIREWARQHDVHIQWHTASQVKHFFTNERLKEREAYLKGMPHATDAARHLFYYLEFEQRQTLTAPDPAWRIGPNMKDIG